MFVQGIELGCIHVKLYSIHFKSDLLSGTVVFGVYGKLPVNCVWVILRNDLADANIFPYPLLAHRPDACALRYSLTL